MKNTQLYPIVTIESPFLTALPSWSNTVTSSIKLSTNNVSLHHIHKGYNDYVGTSGFAGIEDKYHFKPILLNIPSIKQSLDIEDRKFKIHNVSLDISNILIDGKRFSDTLNSTSLINWKCSIQFVSPSSDRFYTIGLINNIASYM